MVSYPGHAVVDLHSRLGYGLDGIMRRHHMHSTATGPECIGSGDSGGAVYLNYGSGASAVGIISGTDNFSVGIGACLNFYTPVSFVAQDYGGSVKIGS